MSESWHFDDYLYLCKGLRIMKTQNSSLEHNFMLLLILMAIIGLAWLFAPFLPALFFATLIASATYGYYEKLSQKTTPTLSAFIMCLSSTLILILPIIYVFLIAGIETSKIAQAINTQFDSKQATLLLQDLLAKLPLSQQMTDNFLAMFNDNIGHILISVKNIFLLIITSITSVTFNFLSFIIIGIFALFYGYIDGKNIVKYMKILSPLDNQLDKILMVEFSQLSITLVSSVFIIALLQGIAFGIGMILIDLPALFFGMSMAIASFIPLLGGLIVWLPLSLYLMINGQTNEGIFVILWGGIVIGGLIDNLCRPWLVGKLSEKFGQKSVLEHTLITVLATLAGIIQLGILGLFIGPIIAAMAISIFHAYTIKYKHSDD